MELQNDQKDALSELINIGFGRAAASLSELLNQRIELSNPIVDIYTIDDINSSFSDSSRFKKDIVVYQTFEGQFQGDVLLIMDIESTTILVDLLSGGNGKPHRFSISDREAMAEVGNIMLNAYIGSFSNLLNYQVKFSMVKLFEEPLPDVIRKIIHPDTAIKFMLLVTTEIKAMNGAVHGKVALLVGEESLHLLTHDMEDLNK